MDNSDYQKFKACGDEIVAACKIKQEVAEGELQILIGSRDSTPDARVFSWEDVLQFGEAQKAFGECEGAMWALNQISDAILPQKPN